MYLMNVPPIAATHTEWRTCGPPQSYSVPLCCDESDTDSPSSGTPIAKKVQMIIESLRSSQSSHDMGDQIEGNGLSVQDVHPQACKGGTGPLLGTRSKGSAEKTRHAGVSSTANSESQECDSDDSVDRGIEEAILEYLKEKDDHKGKPEQPTKVPQPPKVHSQIPPVPESSRLPSESSKVLTASNQCPKSVRVDAPTASSVYLVSKKPSKSKAPFKENPGKNEDANNTGKHAKEQKKCDSKKNGECQTTASALCPVIVKTEQLSPDSSSDDGIEEAIQRYQLEKQSRSSDVCKHPSLKDDSDSSSDDGIEEAIRTYQLEQLKERSALKPFLDKQKPTRKSSLSPVQSTSAGKVQKLKSKKKTEKVVKSAFHSALPIVIHKTMPHGAPKDKGNGVLPSKIEPVTEQRIPATPKVNTSAELMCAEAILDISKAVMPRAFSPHVDLSSINPAQSLSLPSSCLGDRSDDSSIDSEDGIEQEIRKFLEQKAQMHKQSPSTAATIIGPGTSTNELDQVKSKQDTVQRKTLSKQSLIPRGNINLVESNVSPKPAVDHKSKEYVAFISLPEDGRASSPLLSARRGPMPPTTGLDAVQSGDKSSSLDSDEDLDTAIKDLLKTKKKLKKKTRDLKLKTRKCLKVSEPPSGNSLQAKKLKLNPVPKRAILKRAHKSGDEMAARSKLSKNAVSPHKQSSKGNEHLHAGEMEKIKVPGGGSSQPVVQEKEESSSVDSDDSIEQEIRKFLAEKAMVSTVQQCKDGDVPVNTNVEACVPIPDNKSKLENQLAEIPPKNETLLSNSSLLRRPESQISQDREAFPNTQKALPQNTDSTPNVIVPGLNLPLANSHGQGTVKTDNCKSSIEGSSVQDASSEGAGALPSTSPAIVRSQSASVKWRQSLGLPTADPRRLCPSRTPLHITSPKTTETETTTSPLRRGDGNPKPSAALWSPVRGSRSPFCHSAQRPVNGLSPLSFFRPLSAARPSPGQLRDHKQQVPVSGQTESKVLVSKSTLVELAPKQSNHAQVQSRKFGVRGREDPPSATKRKESERVKPEDIGAQLGRAEEEFVDETDCELDDRRSPEKKQAVSTLCLSSAIDPGITLEPYIALTTEARSSRFSRRCIAVNRKENKTVKQVKRKLQFVPVPRYMIN